ncbi:isoquinoline 1-oxidoreductase [Paremcibacter congregatus]|uniref:Isoquinoline 1-oxidoreductase n=2 Tax=Paremcibacter congregatus TaxID=2043170 RepID=A0A2G4YWL3_9PROT|nr:isoquinoline 1-oxidoreductase [Paremcibacter congregatus]QDE29237.1 xanthine dehydrogenase family protein molybdopterin-binding subunit [Paremcibacter congregatus]
MSLAVNIKMDRRFFLKVSGMVGAGLVLAFGLNGKAKAASSEGRPELNTYIRIAPDGSIFIYSKNPEIGQGIKTALPMIIAEELDADWDDVTVEQSPIDKMLFGRQNAGGSRSVASNWNTMRTAGATARHMLIEAAAIEWRVPAEECTTENSHVLHAKTGQKISYGNLATKAAALAVPPENAVKFKDRQDYKILGKRIVGVDNHAMVTGQPLFGIDQVLPGMLYAVYEKCPAVGGGVDSANLDEVRKLPGVKYAFILAGNGNVMELKPGVAIVATTTWAAFQAKKQLKVKWNESNASKDSLSSLIKQAQLIKTQPAEKTLYEKGDVDAAMADSAKSIDALYSFQFAAHATLEPQNCTAWYDNGAIEVWAPTQSPSRGLISVANTLGITEDKVTIHQTRAGGGFGRRLVNDPACEAAAISKYINAPVKLQWTREDDMAHDFYRVGGFHSFKGGIDQEGKIAFLQDHLITFSNNGEKPVIAGAPRQPSQLFPAQLLNNFRLDQSMLPLKARCGLLRAPWSCTAAWAVQSFLHEMAVAAGRDHLEFLLEIMGEPQWLPPKGLYGLNTGRAAAVIKLAAEKAGWGKQLPAGRALGLAFHFSHASYMAEIAEVSVSATKKITVHNVTVAADMGPVVNLSGAENQCQGAVIDGFSTMLGQEITIENGRIQQSNFDTYPLLRMPDAPTVDVHFIQSDNPPTGAGEPALPPLAPAICNAIYAASGYRVRTLPLTKEGFSV